MDEASRERHRRLQEVFWRASELPPEDREKFLREACQADLAGLNEVRRLLSQDQRESSPLDQSLRTLREWCANAETGNDASAELPQDFPGYRILDVLGEGGMGIVYLAEQLEVKRLVALKAIQVGMNTKEVLKRFDVERRVLALMDHENIARVYDAGMAKTGSPYFVMECVQGTRITTYCDRNRLSLDARLEVFLQACRGMEHAHERGIIHRDIKPANVLVTERDGKPIAKLIDFGVAKATDQRIAERSLYTRLGRTVGTPAFMSPEQTRQDPGGVDGRTDVYSLGMLLYELLIGVPPFEALAEASEEEMFRVIREEDPPTPSTRWERLNDERTTALAAKRGGTPTSVRGRIRGEVDWIVMKAIEKAPARRYSSPSELADDVGRFLKGEPVSAKPASLSYRIRKFARRNRGPVAAASCIILALVAGLAASLLLYALAETRLERLLQLSNSKRVRECTAEAEKLWPITHALVDDFEEWLEKSRQLVATLPEYRKQLEDFDQRRPSGDEVGASWWREQLRELVEGLEALRTSTIKDVEWRLEEARTFRKRTIDDYHLEWDEAIASIGDPARCPRYGGLSLTPEEGLIPIGQDPESKLWEFSHLLSGKPARRGPDGRIVFEKDTGIVLVLIPGGSFRMGAVPPSAEHPRGSPNVDRRAEPNEGPVHEIELRPFFISKYELTYGQLWTFTRKRGPDPNLTAQFDEEDYPLLPVESRNWDELQRSLMQMDIDFPTEAQWEYAARAGTTTVFWTGDRTDSLWSGQGGPAGNIADLTAKKHKVAVPQDNYENFEDGYALVAPVGRFRANPFGLHDTVGNVREFCKEPASNYRSPVLPASGERLRGDRWTRVLRGGSWWVDSDYARSSSRHFVTWDHRSHDVGVRPTRRIAP